jgi:hypothetical protein
MPCQAADVDTHRLWHATAVSDATADRVHYITDQQLCINTCSATWLLQHVDSTLDETWWKGIMVVSARLMGAIENMAHIRGF